MPYSALIAPKKSAIQLMVGIIGPININYDDDP